GNDRGDIDAAGDRRRRALTPYRPRAFASTSRSQAIPMRSNPPVPTASARPKSHKWTLFSTITSRQIDFLPTILEDIDDILWIIWMCASAADSGGRRNKENWIGRWRSVKGGR